MSLLTTPERLAICLVDCHADVRNGYHWTQDSIDMIERPAWLVFDGGDNYPQTATEQEQVEASYTLEFVGKPFNLGSQRNVREYELQARQIAVAATQYLLSHQQLQMSNENSRFPAELPPLDGVLFLKINSRAPVTLYTRDGVDEGGHWGFSIDVTITEQLDYEEVLVEAT